MYSCVRLSMVSGCALEYSAFKIWGLRRSKRALLSSHRFPKVLYLIIVKNIELLWAISENRKIPCTPPLEIYRFSKFPHKSTIK